MLNRKLFSLSLLGAVLIAASPAALSAQEILGQGVFSGESGHETSGSVSIVKTARGIEVRLGSNFSLDGAPGPYLGFGNNGKYDASTQFSKLNSNSGAQVYKVPDGIDVAKYGEIYVWCRPFNVPLGVAKLN
ncbi:electron transfer DM13 [bacterium BMS3Bbin10]|nr:electron transfer DM13 [bacterium BMS3Bbin10]